METRSIEHKRPTQATLFQLGQVVATPGALRALEEASAGSMELLRRHQKGDWGQMSETDKLMNVEAVSSYSRLFSAYELSTGKRIWVITEADRSATTILLPSDY